VSTAYKDLHR